MPKQDVCPCGCNRVIIGWRVVDLALDYRCIRKCSDDFCAFIVDVGANPRFDVPERLRRHDSEARAWADRMLSGLTAHIHGSSVKGVTMSVAEIRRDMRIYAEFNKEYVESVYHVDGD